LAVSVLGAKYGNRNRDGAKKDELSVAAPERDNGVGGFARRRLRLTLGGITG
jgi:hypothetical protein